MKRRLFLFMIILVSLGSMAARYTPPNYKAQHWDVTLNAIIAQAGTDIDTLYSNVTNLGNLVTNWISTVDSLTLIQAAPTYSDDHTFTVPGDWTRLDERALSASLVAASAAISGRGSVRRVEVVSQSPRRRTGMQTAR